MFKRVFLLSLLTILSINSFLFSAESKKSQLSELDFVPTEEQRSFPEPIIPREKSGPFISSNTGISFLFNQSSFMLSSPVYEAIIGYHLGNSFKIATAYQFQQAPMDVRFQGHAFVAGKKHAYNYSVNSGVHLQSLALKLFVSPAHPYRWKILTLSPYFSVGTGLGFADVKGMFKTRTTLFMADCGLCFGTSFISTTAGCRYNSWSWDNGIFSIAPYAGLQISF